ncbi:MAG: DDE-type integrase/transposase/recombinase [Thermoleophilia bacterium]
MPERAVRPQAIVEPPPAGDQNLRFLERVEEFAVQEFVSRQRVARLMARRGIVGRARRRTKRTTIADPAAVKTADLLKRNFAPQAHEIDTAWCGDISYVRTWEGFAYVATVIDLSSRRVVGLAMADHLRSSLASEALQMAVKQRQPAPGLIFHLRPRLSVHGS